MLSPSFLTCCSEFAANRSFDMITSVFGVSFLGRSGRFDAGFLGSILQRCGVVNWSEAKCDRRFWVNFLVFERDSHKFTSELFLRRAFWLSETWLLTDLICWPGLAALYPTPNLDASEVTESEVGELSLVTGALSLVVLLQHNLLGVWIVGTGLFYFYAWERVLLN